MAYNIAKKILNFDITLIDALKEIKNYKISFQKNPKIKKIKKNKPRL